PGAKKKRRRTRRAKDLQFPPRADTGMVSSPPVEVPKMLDSLSPLARRVFEMHAPGSPPQFCDRADPFTDDAALRRIDAAYSELVVAGLMVGAGGVATVSPGVSGRLLVLIWGGAGVR